MSTPATREEVVELLTTALTGNSRPVGLLRARAALDALEQSGIILVPAEATEPKPITMGDVRLAVGEGKLSAADVLAGCNAELRRRASISSSPYKKEQTNG